MTGTPSKAGGIFGDKLYQQRARLALPILVRQAAAGKSLTYGELANELNMPNARNLNFVLGCIGVALEQLGEEWNEKIPLIQCLVKNQETGMPGDGVFEFLFSLDEIKALAPAQKEIAIDAILAKIFIYTKWEAVLKHFDLRHAKSNFDSVVNKARNRSSGGESDLHKALKMRIAQAPQLVGMSAKFGIGEQEYGLPSGDSVDVVFTQAKKWLAVEVKSKISSVDDIARGLFQCVKYRAVISAWRGSLSETIELSTILALGGEMPAVLEPLRVSLGVTVVDCLST